MTFRGHQRPGPRADVRTRAEIRAAWIELLIEADRTGRAYVRDRTMSEGAEMALRHRIARNAGLAFPLAWSSAADAAAGFRLLARGFLDSAVPDLKAALAEAMATAARCCTRMLAEEEAQAAAAYTRQRDAILGERPDEED